MEGLIRLLIPSEVVLLASDTEQRPTLIRESRHKPSKGGYAPDQALHLSYILGWLHIQDDLDFIWVSFNAAAIDHVTEELARLNSEDALLWVELDVQRSEYFNRFL